MILFIPFLTGAVVERFVARKPRGRITMLRAIIVIPIPGTTNWVTRICVSLIPFVTYAVAIETNDNGHCFQSSKKRSYLLPIVPTSFVRIPMAIGKTSIIAKIDACPIFLHMQRIAFTIFERLVAV